MSPRRLVTGLTLLVAAGVLAVMAVWGYDAATAPIADGPADTASGPPCPPDSQTVTKYERRGDVTVSVFNAGTKSGSAQAALDLLEQAGFKPGQVGNAPDGVDVKHSSGATRRRATTRAPSSSPALSATAPRWCAPTTRLGPRRRRRHRQQVRAISWTRTHPSGSSLAQPVTSCD